MKFCSACGERVISSVPAGDNRMRTVCPSCGTIHYRNPLIVAGCVPEFEGHILLCKRAIEPRKGYWTVPAGFMEIGETLAEAAARETWEEALTRVNIGALYCVVDVVDAAQVHVFFTGEMTTPEFGAGTETLETRLLPPEDIPWDDLAFPSIRIALEQYLDARQTGHLHVRLSAAPRRPA